MNRKRLVVVLETQARQPIVCDCKWHSPLRSWAASVCISTDFVVVKSQPLCCKRCKGARCMVHGVRADPHLRPRQPASIGSVRHSAEPQGAVRTLQSHVDRRHPRSVRPHPPLSSAAARALSGSSAGSYSWGWHTPFPFAWHGVRRTHTDSAPHSHNKGSSSVRHGNDVIAVSRSAATVGWWQQ